MSNFSIWEITDQQRVCLANSVSPVSRVVEIIFSLVQIHIMPLGQLYSLLLWNTISPLLLVEASSWKGGGASSRSLRGSPGSSP